MKLCPKDRTKEFRMKARPIGFVERLRAMFDVPAWAIGAVTVVVLLAVFLYPREAPPSVIALSSVTWENVPKPKAFQPTSETHSDNHRFERFSPRSLVEPKLMRCMMRSLRLWMCTSVIMLRRRLQ